MQEKVPPLGGHIKNTESLQPTSAASENSGRKRFILRRINYCIVIVGFGDHIKGQMSMYLWVESTEEETVVYDFEWLVAHLNRQ